MQEETKQVKNMFEFSSLFGKYVDRISADSEDPAVRKIAALLKHRSAHPFARSMHVRMVDAGSPNDVELEEGLTNSPQVDCERFGIHYVASPRHADVLLVSGPVTVNARIGLIRTYEAMPDPKAVVAVGDGACSGWPFSGSYAIFKSGKVEDVLPVDVKVPGNPPSPYEIVYGILKAGERLSKRAPAPESK